MEMSVREARAQFAAAIQAAERGERVTITKHGKAVAELGPPTPAPPKPKWDWDELDRLQERLGIPTPSPEASEWIEKHFDSEEFNREIWGDLYA
ncbi:type II toxin-antitoxin system prevent-host-death family antitoxin [Sphingomonas sp.]|uniref:type II toxin-antitoxin system prevent-host-death family antitoxin n=1 Tax=Sphingomonas sp. TaxID=28214 RepID=UPI003CC5CCE5